MVETILSHIFYKKYFLINKNIKATTNIQNKALVVVKAGATKW